MREALRARLPIRDDLEDKARRANRTARRPLKGRQAVGIRPCGTLAIEAFAQRPVRPSPSMALERLALRPDVVVPVPSNPFGRSPFGRGLGAGVLRDRTRPSRVVPATRVAQPVVALIVDQPAGRDDRDTVTPMTERRASGYPPLRIWRSHGVQPRRAPSMCLLLAAKQRLERSRQCMFGSIRRILENPRQGVEYVTVPASSRLSGEVSDFPVDQVGMLPPRIGGNDVRLILGDDLVDGLPVLPTPPNLSPYGLDM